MSDVNTIRILSLDGGGERGYLSLQFLKRFIQLWGIDPATLAQQFDVICGTSIGGLMALYFSLGKTPDEVEPFFTVQGPYIFSLTSLTPSVRPNLAAKLALIAANTPFYQSSGPTASDYGSGLLAATAQAEFGANTLQNAQTNVIIPAYQYDTSTYTLFSNLNYPEFIGQNALMSDVALSTSAAPVYLPAWTFGGQTYLDGGVYQNNPASTGRTLAQMVKPLANRCCVLSLGTGLGTRGFDPGAVRVSNPTSIEIIFDLFSIASTGCQEAIDEILYLESTYAMTQLYYYRFQPILDPELDTELDNTDPAILAYYDTVAETTFNNDIDDISTFLGHLIA